MNRCKVVPLSGPEASMQHALREYELKSKRIFNL